MTTPHIYLAFTDDWELRGNGAGDIEQLQFRPMTQLLDTFDSYDVKSTFMVEVMQQLAFRAEQGRHPELGTLADRWDESVLNAYARGHDIQLHVHPQWSTAEYADGRWRLSGDWSLLNYTPDLAAAMIDRCKQYLETLLRQADPSYRCVAFRSGSSVIAPSPFILNVLAEAGLVFDLSIVGGLAVNTRNVQFDYTLCDEDFLPFYPQMDDARRVSANIEPIVCVPIFHFWGSRRRAIAELVSKAMSKIKNRSERNKVNTASSTGDDWAEIGRSSIAYRIYDKAIRPALLGKHLTADIGQLDTPLFLEMLNSLRERAKLSGVYEVPIILTNHSKYMGDTAAIEGFVNLIASAEDITPITLSQLAAKLTSGQFKITKASIT